MSHESTKFIVYPLWPVDPVMYEDFPVARSHARRYAKMFGTPIVIKSRTWDPERKQHVDALVVGVEPDGHTTSKPWRETDVRPA